MADILMSARFKVKREIEQLVASLNPRDSAPTIIRKLPDLRTIFEAPAVPARTAVPVTNAPAAEPRTVASLETVNVEAHSAASPSGLPVMAYETRTFRPAVAQLAPERYRLQLTISRATHDKLRRVQDLARHSTWGQDLAEIVGRALTLLLADLERRRCAATPAPRPWRGLKEGSRHIPAAVKRALWRRDAGRCAFVGKMERCKERAFLEFHHVVPYAAGGAATTENIELRCRAHNKYEAVLFFAPERLRERPPAYGHGTRRRLTSGDRHAGFRHDRR